MKRWTYDEGVLYLGDCQKVMRKLPEQSIDLIISSPPYEDSRSYGIDFNLKGEDWVAWMVDIFKESLRVCKGLVAYVVGHGKTEGFSWSAVPALLAADLKRSGVVLRNPPIYRRDGIMGAGGPDWLCPKYEWIICATNTADELPWSDNTACGTPPKWGIGGRPSHRDKEGRRKTNKLMKEEGISQREAAKRVGYVKYGTTGSNKHDTINSKGAVLPEIVNPGNIIDCGAVGGGRLGSKIAHENEAPFPEKIPNFFIRSFCPPDGVVLDPFTGSGTTISQAIQLGRRFVGIDIRPSQIELVKRRIKQARLRKGFGLYS